MAWKLRNLIPRKADSNQLDADHWFARGNAHAARQEWQSALHCYGKAIALDPDNAEAHANSGNVFRHLSDPDAALAAYDRAIAVKPNYAMVHYNRGVVLQQAGQPLGALGSYDIALSIDNSFKEALCGRGDILREMGRLGEAMDSYDAAIAVDSSYSKGHLHLGTLQHQLQQPYEAEASYKRAIAVQPDYVDAHAHLGALQFERGELDAALLSVATVIRLKPDLARAFGNRAQIQARLGRLAEARASHDRAVALDSSDATLHFNRGDFLSDCNEMQDAIPSYRAAIGLKSDYAEAYCNLGLAQQETGQDDAALDSYSRALAINPALATVFNNRGNLYRSRGRFDESLRDYRQAVSLSPDFVEAHYNTGQLALLRGDFAAGWPLYEYRHRTKEAIAASPRELPYPPWFGEHSIQGKDIFLHAEQGLGDTIQFCRYVPMVAAMGARVTLEIQPALGELLADLDGVSRMVLFGSPIPQADYQCSLMSLPGAFDTTLETIPRQVPYLRADPARVARWRDFLGPRRRPRVGLAWRGNPRNSNDSRRRVPLATLLEHLPHECEYFCLHDEICEEDRDVLRSNDLVNIAETDLDMSETAALIETLDLVVSVCTSLAHLSGALGKKTWILLAFQSDWRWLLQRRDSPWYPTATLYRQRFPHDWSDVLSEVSKDLVALPQS